MAGNEVADIVSGRANLLVSKPGTEAEVVGKEQWEEIHRLHQEG